MVTIITTIALALALAGVVLIMSRAKDTDQLSQVRRVPLMMGVQIICADCAGEGYQPRRTYLDRNGYCAQCGGSSFLLASIIASQRARARADHLRELETAPRRGRVLPFEVKGARVTRRDKIAV